MIHVERGIGVSIKGTATDILNDICNVIVKMAENYDAVTDEGKEKILRDLLNMGAQVISCDEDGTVITKQTEDSDPLSEAFSIGCRIQNLWEDYENG